MFVYKNKHLSSPLPPPLGLCLALRGLCENRGVSRKSTHIYSKHKHAKSEDKPLQIQLLRVGIPNETWGWGTGPRKKIINQSTFINGAHKLASGVFNTSFFSAVCLIFLSLNIQKKVHSPTSTN